jgi:hypothetical protein
MGSNLALHFVYQDSDPRRYSARLFDAAPQGALEIKQVPVKPSLVRELG